jgi:hypothetical protein
MMVKHTISAVSSVRNVSNGTQQNSLNNFFLKKIKRKEIVVLFLLKDFPDDSSQDSADYGCNPKQPELT